MDERKRGTSNGKRRLQSIEKTRRDPQRGQQKRPPSRKNYSDGYSSRAPRSESTSGEIYNFDNFLPESERRKSTRQHPQQQRTRQHPQQQRPKQRRPSQNRPPVKRETGAQIKKTKTAKTRRPKQQKPISRAKLRFRRFILSFLAISIVILVGVYLSLTVWFKTETIRVEGETRYSSERVLEVCPIDVGENIFLADKKTAAETIKNTLPYVGTAEVRFSIPNTIIVKITDASPAYQISDGNGYYAISAEGRILEKLQSKQVSIPTVECSGLNNPDIGGYAEFSAENVSQILSDVVAELEALEINNITVIDITNAAQVKLFYDDRILILIGMPEEINYKLRTALAIINDKLDPNNSGVITGRLDVSVVNDTKKSYFNENEVYTPPSQTQPSIAQPAIDQTDPTDETDTDGEADPDGSADTSEDFSGEGE